MRLGRVWGSYEAEGLPWEPCPGAHRKGHAGACWAVALAPAALRQQHGELMRRMHARLSVARGALAGVGSFCKRNPGTSAGVRLCPTSAVEVEHERRDRAGAPFRSAGAG